MTFINYFDNFKKKFDGVDVSDITEHLAFQFTVKDETMNGVFYIEIKECSLYMEPCACPDRDAAFSCTSAMLDKIISGKTDICMAHSLQKLEIDGDKDKAFRLKELVARQRLKGLMANQKTMSVYIPA